MIDSNAVQWMSSQGIVIRRPIINNHWTGSGCLDNGDEVKICTLRDKYSYLDIKLTYAELEELDEYMKQFEW